MTIHHPRLCATAAALWWGSLTSVGFFVVPMLFVHLQPAAVAGNLAAKLFSGQTWISVVCGLVLLVVARGRARDENATPPLGLFGLVLGGMLLALLSEYAVSPRIVARENLRLWHAVGSGFYLLQWACAGLSFWKLLSAASPLPAAAD